MKLNFIQDIVKEFMPIVKDGHVFYYKEINSYANFYYPFFYCKIQIYTCKVCDYSYFITNDTKLNQRKVNLQNKEIENIPSCEEIIMKKVLE